MESYLDGWQGVTGGEVSLRVPHAPAGLHLIRDQLVGTVDLHRGVDDAVGRAGLQVSHFQNDHLRREIIFDVRTEL